MRKSKTTLARRARKKVSAFTLIELLMVIAILGILGALSIPVIKNFGKSDATLGASRQLLDDVGRARQLAISQRTTVYMVFVPANFWTNGSGVLNTAWFNALTPAQKTAVTNLADKQLTGYTFIARGALGDQPGKHAWHYLAPWQGLPEGTFIAFQKFTPTTNTISDGIDPNKFFQVIGFNTRSDVPFPTEASISGPLLPYIAFNYLGQLTADGQALAPRDEYIPLAHGSVQVLKDTTTRAIVLPSPPNNSPDVAELPPGNSTNSAYNIVHIDRLSGRATLEFQKMQ